MKKKYISLILVVFFALLLVIKPTETKKIIFSLIPDKVENNLKVKIKSLIDNSPIEVQYIAKILFKNSSNRRAAGLPSSIEVFNNDYNIKFLPETQTINLKLIKKFISTNSNSEVIKKGDKLFADDGPYISINPSIIRSMDIYNDNLLIAYGINNFAYSKIHFKTILSQENIEFKEIKTNFKNGRILDISISDEIIYISYVTKKNNCNYLNIFFAEISLDIINFKPLLESDECSKQSMSGGRIKKYNHNGRNGILITTSEIKMNAPSNNAQSDQSIIGKILFLDTISKNVINFSKGHRNPQGLYVEDKLILSTEHGPQGGDEINKIVFGGNYGWPLASYGSRYNKIRNGENNIEANKSLKYNKSHSEMSFIEPVYSFIPSIGISEMIKIPTNFSEEFKDNFFISSLNDKSLYRIKFSKNFSRVIYSEKIYIGHRIRDIKFDQNNNNFILLLEDPNGPEFGFLINHNDE